MLEILPKAPPPEPRKLTERELTRLREEEEGTLRELRLFLRDMLNKLGQDRKFGIFTKPVEIEDVGYFFNFYHWPLGYSRPLVKNSYPIFFSYFSTKTYVVGTQKNRLNETVLLSTQNIC